MRGLRQMRPLVVGVVAATVVGLTGPVAHADLAAAPGPVPGGSPALVGADGRAGDGQANRRIVTLITGDQVEILQGADGQPASSVTPAPGRDPNVSFRTHIAPSGLYVIPSDVERLVPDLLDPELFNVSALVDMGYDDAHAEALPMIMERADGGHLAAAPATELTVTRALPSIDSTAVTLAHEDAADLGAVLAEAARAAPRTGAVTTEAVTDLLGGVDHVWLDARLTATAAPAEPDAVPDQYLTDINAPAGWDAGLSGDGVTVAVLDSGVDAEHPDLVGQIGERANFTDVDIVADDVGHGTHVASLVAGTGAMADGARRGVAYDADIISGKVLRRDPVSGRGVGQESWAIAGMEWAAAHGADIVNMSLGAPPGLTYETPIDAAVNELTATTGSLFVVAAGNLGPGGGSIETPGQALAALTVGATRTGQNLQAFFSSAGPTRWSLRAKPDIAAPGTGILGARAGGGRDNPYVSMDGTSMATPQVAGAAALILQRHPDWGPERVKSALVTTGDLSDNALATPYTQGGGRLDLARATHEVITGTGDLDFPIRWDDRGTHTREITLSNPGSEAVDVDLTAALAAGGPSAPDGLFTVEPEHLTVPAGGTATATVTVNPIVGDLATWYSGYLVVSDGSGPLVHFPVGIAIEPEMYDLHVKVIDADGNPAAFGTVDILNRERMNFGSFTEVPLDANGELTIRLRAADYSVLSRIETPGPDGGVENISVAGYPELSVGSDTTITIDARKAEPLTAPVIEGTSTVIDEAILMMGTVDEEGFGFDGRAVHMDAAMLGRGAIRVQPTVRPVTHGTFAVTVHWRLVTPPFGNGAGAGPTTPRVFDLVDQWPGFDTTPRRVTAKDIDLMARLDTSYYDRGGDDTRYLTVRQFRTDKMLAVVNMIHDVDVPGHRIEYVSTGDYMVDDDEPTWETCVLTTLMREVGDNCVAPRVFDSGDRETVTWHNGGHMGIYSGWRSSDITYVEFGFSEGVHHAPVASTRYRDAWMSVAADGRQLFTGHEKSGWVDVPEDASDFVVEGGYTLGRGHLFPRDIVMSGRWVFHQERPDLNLGSVPFPLLDIVYEPAIDLSGTAPAGRDLPVDLTVVRTTDAASTPVAADLTVEYSADHGRTWHRADVTGDDGGRYHLTVPADAVIAGGTVSFGVSALADDGSRVDQTTLGMVAVAGG